MVEVGTGTSSSKFLKTKYPIAVGLIAGSTSQIGMQTNLIPEKGTLVAAKDRVGIESG